MESGQLCDATAVLERQYSVEAVYRNFNFFYVSTSSTISFKKIKRKISYPSAMPCSYSSIWIDKNLTRTLMLRSVLKGLALLEMLLLLQGPKLTSTSIPMQGCIGFTLAPNFLLILVR